MSNILNIPCNYNFLSSLKEFIKDNFNDEDNLIVILPNHHSCHEFKLKFTKENFNVVLPIIKSINDIAISDISLFINQQQTNKLIEEMINIKKIDSFESIFLIAKELQKSNIFGNINFEQLCKISFQFQNLFDDIEYEGINLDSINTLDNNNLAIHQQINLEFVKKFYLHVKQILISQNLLYSSAYQNLLISKLSENINQFGLINNVIIAGSTGSVCFIRKLIKSISKENRGKIILNNHIDIKNPKANHCQYLNNQLVKFLQKNNELIENIKYKKFQISQKNRFNFLTEFIKPSHEISSWKDIVNYQDFEDLKYDINNNILTIETENKIQEAQVITDFISNNNLDKKIGIITNDPILTNLLENNLFKKRLNFQNNILKNLDQHPIIEFISLILEIKETNFDSIKILSLIKNNLFDPKFKNLSREFELLIIRESRKIKGLEGLIDKANENHQLANFLSFIVNSLPAKNDIDSIISSVENFTGKSWLSILNKDINGKEISIFFNKVKNINHQFFNCSELKFMASLFNYEENFEHQYQQCNISILSSIEARLINFDIAIICGMNDGLFPKKTEINWLGAKILNEIGIEQSEKKYGQNYFDFINYLSCPKILITRSIKENETKNIASPFFLKLIILLKIINKDQFHELSQNKNKLDKINYKVIDKPQYRVEKEYLPKKISVSDIINLIEDPFIFYLQKILNLTPNKNIDYKPSYMEYGSFVHKVLELSTNKILNNQEIENIFQNYFCDDQSQFIWLSKFLKNYQKFSNDNLNFKNKKNITEHYVEFQNNFFKINGKIDRIIFENENNILLIDYKTGITPTKNQVKFGNQIQLGLYANLLKDKELFKNITISKILYWQIDDGIEYIATEINDVNQILENANNKINSLIDQFYIESKPFIANVKNKKNNYNNLVRTQEWSQ